MRLYLIMYSVTTPTLTDELTNQSGLRPSEIPLCLEELSHFFSRFAAQSGREFDERRFRGVRWQTFIP